MKAVKEWNHNNHYHDWIISQLPPRIERAIDIGCGRGEFSRRLSLIAGHVDSIDHSPTILAEAIAQTPKDTNISYLAADFLEAKLDPENYDGAVLIASLHHMELSAALQKLTKILKPGGTLVILGLYRQTGPIDFVLSVVSKTLDVIINARLSIALHKPVDQKMQIADPKHTFREIYSAAKVLLPTMKMRRHLFWRYSIVWRKPETAHPRVLD